MQLIPMTDIKEMTPEFQKLNKTDNCIVIYLKNDARIAVTSQVTITHVTAVHTSTMTAMGTTTTITTTTAILCR